MRTTEKIISEPVGVDKATLVTLRLEGADFDAFVKVLENPPAPGPKLRKLMRRIG